MRRSTDRNVLFVIVDDLRQQLAHTSPLEGEDTSFMVTPVLDGLAREAVSFRRARRQAATQDRVEHRRGRVGSLCAAER